MFYSYVFNTFLPKMTNFLRFFYKIHRVFIFSSAHDSYPQAPLRSVHTVTEIASSRRIGMSYIKKRRCKAPSHKNTNIIWLLFYNMHIHLRERYIDSLLCKCLVNFLIYAEKDIPILS